MTAKKILDAVEWQNFADIILSKTTNNQTKKQLLETVDVNAKRKDDGKTFLQAACVISNKDAVTFLLNHGADVNLGDKKNIRPLLIAAQRSLSIVKTLVEKGADINFIANDEARDYPPISAAIISKRFTIFEYLLGKGADVNLKCRKLKLSPLYYAASEGSISTVKALLANGANPNSLTFRLETALIIAIEYLNKPLVEVLLKGGANPNLQNNNKVGPLFHLVNTVKDKYNSTIQDIFELLLKYKAKINQQHDLGRTVLAQAIINENPQLVKLALQHNADVNQLITLAENYKGNLMHLIANKEPNKAVKEIVPLLFAKSINIELKDTDIGNTPLHCAVNLNSSWLVEKLLKQGADPNVQRKHDNNTPLMLACQANKINSVKALLAGKRRKVKLDLGNKNGERAVHHVALDGSLPILKLLTQHKADLNAQTQDGTTSLFCAAQEGNVEVVEYLLEQGADPDIVRHDNSSCLFVAHAHEHKAVVNVFLEFYLKHIKDYVDFDYKEVTNILLPGGASQFGLQVFAIPNEAKLLKLQEKLTLFEAISSPPALSKSNYSFFAHDDKPAASYSTYQTRAQSSYSFLTERGFSKEDIKKMRMQNQQILATPSSFSEPSHEALPITWFNGLLTSTMDQIEPIGGQDNKTPNCFLYLDIQTLAKQGCEQLEIFDNLLPKFCAKKGEQGIKPLKGNLNIKVQVQKQVSEYELTHEVKILASPARILCFRVNSDDNRASLFVGVIYAHKGLHNKSDESKYKLDSKTIVLHVPEQLKTEKSFNPTLR